MLQRELGQAPGVLANGLRGRVDENGADATLRHRHEGPIVIRDGTHADGQKLDTELPTGSLGGLQEGLV